MTKNVKETTKYDNKLDILNTSTENPPDLIDFLDIELDSDDNTYRHWVGMPEFIQEKNPPFKKLIVTFRWKEDYDEFSKIIGQNLTNKTKSIWYPKLDKEENSLMRWIEE